MASTAQGTFTCWDGFDIFEEPEPIKRPARRPSRPRRYSSSSATPTERPPAPQPTAVDGARDQDYTDLKQLWETLREKKHQQEVKRPVKVKSLATPPAGSSGLSRSPPQQDAVPRKATPPQLKKKKSTDCVTFSKSPCGRSITAEFHLSGVKKEQVHVGFRWKQLTVTWETVKITEKKEGGQLVREREEKKYSRTIPLPHGTKFEEIDGKWRNGHLFLNYPNMRIVRVSEPPPRPPRHAETRRIVPTEVESSDVHEY
ncbi:hypothetical protein F5I97DRAFT_1438331 [Phlebopus sp. FC_14]|nr:hypothetical protein F5I97DRAFT_1438331 [Phlebopus sp. FC_14]